MKTIRSDKLSESFFRYEEPEELEAVKLILQDVEQNGDAAVRRYIKKFDKAELKTFEVSKAQVRKAYKAVDKETLSALRKAAERIRSFAKKQYGMFKNFETKKDGVVLGQRIIPLERVGCYVPGGNYPLASTALMCAIPAKVAGVGEVIVCSPKITNVTIVAADIAGADRIFRIGGVQAIGAMAYGTETVPKVDKIVGPGNKYVTAAKKEVYGIVGIDFIAGPSEVLIIADATGNQEFIATDLLAQAEHDTFARSFLLTTSQELAEAVNKEVDEQLERLKTKSVSSKALNNGAIVLVENLNDAVAISNKLAPEHLGLQVKQPEKLLKKLRNYGSLFIGPYSAIAFGDYCSGTNHVLPTNGAARYAGGLSVRDFVKIVTYQEVTKRGADELVDIASVISSAEGMEGHRKSAIIRKTY